MAVTPFLVYTALRLLVFGALLGILWVVGLSGFTLFALAVVLSMPVSYVVLSRQRESLGRVVEGTVTGRREQRARFRASLRGDTTVDGGEAGGEGGGGADGGGADGQGGEPPARHA